MAALLAALLLSGCATAKAEQEDTGFQEVAEQTEHHPELLRERILAYHEDQEPAQAEQVGDCAHEWEAWTYSPCDGYDESLNNNLAYLDHGRYNNSFQSDGVAHIGDTEFNWYSQNVMPGGGLEELNNNGRHVDEESGFVVDGDGFIAVASPWGVDEVGTEIETPFGPGKVYDENQGDTYDLYTDF